MKNILCLFIILHFSINSVFGQKKENPRWEFILLGGFSQPVGSYGKNNPSEAVIRNPNYPEFPIPKVIGFNKSKDGFALTGYYYNGELKYKLKNSMFFNLRAGKFNNPVETEALSNYLTTEMGGEQLVEHVDYNINHITTGVGYTIQLIKFDIGFNVFGGYATVNYPYYKSILLYTISQPYSIWAHDGEQPTLSTFTYGGTMFINYHIGNRFGVGLNATYQRADFDYYMYNRVIPGGSSPYDFNDTLVVKVLNVGLSLSVKF